MLKAFFYGAMTALIGSKLKKMNDQGRLEPLKRRAKKGATLLRNQVSNLKERADAAALTQKDSSLGTLHRPAPPPVASAKARMSPSDDVSKPARAHPWPVDPRALPRAH